MKTKSHSFSLGVKADSALSVVSADASYSYNQLVLFSESIAESLRDRCVSNHSPVALILPRGFLLYASELAVLSAGGFFLPVDPDNPIERIQFLLSDSDATTILVTDETESIVDTLPAEADIINVTDLLNRFLSSYDPSVGLQGTELQIPHGPDDLAYMIYTSGSTGRPKGVPIKWSALENHNSWFIDEYNISSSDKCLQMASVGFDISLEEIFTTLRAGAQLFPIDGEAMESPAKFFQWVESQQLTVLNIPTALWHNLVPALENVSLADSVRLVFIGGEQVDANLVRTWFRHVPREKVRLVNAYGPTEATITCTVCDLSVENYSSIGDTIQNVDGHIIDPVGNVVDAVDVAGELYLSGVALSPGYWNRPEKTKQAFVSCEQLDGLRCYRTGDKVKRDSNGNLHFLGRLDNQIKLRGFRIELDEIAHRVACHPQIKSAVVRKVEEKRPFLACFATTNQEVENVDRLKKDVAEFVREALPHYMVPSQFCFYDQFPITVGGKVDVSAMEISALSEASNDNVENWEQLSELEQQVAESWSFALGGLPNTIDDSFEDCGGDSFAAMSLAIELEKKFTPVRFGVSTLLQCPTVRELATYIETNDEANNDTSGGGENRPTITSVGRDLVNGSNASENVLILFHPGGGAGYLYNGLLNDEIKDKYSVLLVDSPLIHCAEIPDQNENVSSIVQNYLEHLIPQLDKRSTIVTGGFSFGANLAWEAARSLKQKGFKIGKVINIDQPVATALEHCNLGKRLINWSYRLQNPKLNKLEMENASSKNKVRRAIKKGRKVESNELLRSVLIEDFYAKIEDDYVPEPFPIDLCIIRGEIFQAKYKLPKDYGWGAFAEKVTVRRVSGTHGTLFMGEHLSRLASEFQAVVLNG